MCNSLEVAEEVASGTAKAVDSNGCPLVVVTDESFSSTSIGTALVFFSVMLLMLEH